MLTENDLLSALPDTSSTIHVDGLISPVVIVRDAFGVPHINASSEHDVFFAQGYATAQDRLWQMDYDRHRALGRWSSWVGASGLVEDRLMRTMGLESAAKADLAVSSKATVDMISAYTAGVNAFINTTATLPVEYRLLGTGPDSWEPWHCIAVYKVRNMLMGSYEGKLWRARLTQMLGPEKSAKLFLAYPDDSLVSTPPGDVFGEFTPDVLAVFAKAAEALAQPGETDAGSNAWVISGDRTKSGLPLVAGDSHRALDTPNVYYQNHIACTSFRCSGFSVPGVPGMPHFSHTEYAAWGMTHGMADYQDLYIEKFRIKEGVLQYARGPKWFAAEVRYEQIDIRGEDPEELQVVSTPHGPIVAGSPSSGSGLAFRHTGTESGTPWMNTVYQLLHAKNADEIEAAVADWTEPVNNFVYADVHGEFGYRYRGRIPVRHEDNAWTPVPGWEEDHEWQGEIPFTELPAVRNPKAGFVVTCNNAPTTADYPHYISTAFAPDWRARRVTSRIENIKIGTADVAAMADIHADRLSLPSELFRRRLHLLEPVSDVERTAHELMMAWDGEMDRDLAAPTIYSAWRVAMFAELMNVAFGPLVDETRGTAFGIGKGAAAHTVGVFSRGLKALEQDDISVLEMGDDWDAVMIRTFSVAISSLVEKLGRDPTTWLWGDSHRTKPKHPLSRVFPDDADRLDPPSMRVHGDSDTPLAGAYSQVDPFISILMSVNRYIHDPSDWRRSRWIVPLGASGHPGSVHYADQSTLWSDIKTIPQLWDWDDIVAQAETTQRLEPE